MDRNDVILVTGAAGFIGSCLVGYLNRKGYKNIIIADHFDDNSEKFLNFNTKEIFTRIEREELIEKINQKKIKIDFVFHLGARTDTTEFDYSIHEKLNVAYSKSVWQYCTENKIPLVYASSAATYGDGALGYEDNHNIIENLQPLNPYGVSKNEFDKWVLKQTATPPFWAGLKFFNVYGPNEYHKGRMASVIFHAFNQIKKTGKLKLFQSHKDGINDGDQKRDFIYVKDVVQICFWLMLHKPTSGIYNVGTGKARTFNDLAELTFAAMNLKKQVEYIPTPEDIREKYQYFTEANMDKLLKVGYDKPFHSFEEGISIYVKEFLNGKKYY